MAEDVENPEELEIPEGEEFEKLAETLQDRCKAANIPFSKEIDTSEELALPRFGGQGVNA
ncbi:MAG: hypothetical protein ABI042_15700 [Verrucomicrobiota bacterium]